MYNAAINHFLPPQQSVFAASAHMPIQPPPPLPQVYQERMGVLQYYYPIHTRPVSASVQESSSTQQTIMSHNQQQQQQQQTSNPTQNAARISEVIDLTRSSPLPAPAPARASAPSPAPVIPRYPFPENAAIARINAPASLPPQEKIASPKEPIFVPPTDQKVRARVHAIVSKGPERTQASIVEQHAAPSRDKRPSTAQEPKPKGWVREPPMGTFQILRNKKRLLARSIRDQDVIHSSELKRMARTPWHLPVDELIARNQRRWLQAGEDEDIHILENIRMAIYAQDSFCGLDNEMIWRLVTQTGPKEMPGNAHVVALGSELRNWAMRRAPISVCAAGGFIQLFLKKYIEHYPQSINPNLSEYQFIHYCTYPEIESAMTGPSCDDWMPVMVDNRFICERGVVSDVTIAEPKEIARNGIGLRI